MRTSSCPTARSRTSRAGKKKQCSASVRFLRLINAANGGFVSFIEYRIIPQHVVGKVQAVSRTKEVDRYCESALMGAVLSIMPEDMGLLRELRIQNLKLMRMIESHLKKTGHPTNPLLGGPLKKWKKREGKGFQLIAAQDKKVRSMRDKLFKEYLRRENPSFSNAEFASWKIGFEASSKKMVKTLQANVVSRITGKTT